MPYKDPAKRREYHNCKSREYNKTERRKAYAREYMRRYRRDHPGSDKRTWEERRPMTTRKNREIQLEAFNAYGGPKCACCGETLVEGLSIDHVNGGGEKHRRIAGGGGTAMYRWLKKNNYPPGYQVLCMTCNFAKGGGDHCPHQDVANR